MPARWYVGVVRFPHTDWCALLTLETFYYLVGYYAADDSFLSPRRYCGYCDTLLHESCRPW